MCMMGLLPEFRGTSRMRREGDQEEMGQDGT